MSMLSLQTNLPSMRAMQALGTSQMSLERSLTRLSTGFRINQSGDDAAGLAISENLKSRIRSLVQARRNANDGVSVINTAEGAMQEMTNILVRLRELSVQAANDTLGSSERSFLDLEFDDLKAELDRIAATTEFNGQSLLNGSLSTAGLDFQVGADNDVNNRIMLTIAQVSTTGLGLVTAIGVGTKTAAQTSMSVVDAALVTLSSQRAKLGAVGNRLQSTINNLGVATESLTAANSRIRDVDVAEETSALARSQVLVQAGVSMLAQANMAPQMILRLVQ